LAFHREAALRHAKAAEGAGRHIVRVHGVTVHRHVRDLVRPACVGCGAQHHVVAQAGIRPCVAVNQRLVCQQGAILAGSSLETDDRGVALGMHQQRLPAAEHHLDRAAGGLCQQRDVDLNRNVLFASECASNKAVDHPDLRIRNVQRGGDLFAVAERNLPPAVDRYAAVCSGNRQSGLRLDKGVFDRLRVVFPLDDDVRLREAGL